MGCEITPYINLSNLEADGCCPVLGANELQYNAAQYYYLMSPYIMEQAKKAAAADAFGNLDAENRALDAMNDIHMLYGYLLSVHFQRVWDAELDTVCHRDFGNKYYYDKYKFECLAEHFLCLGIDIYPVLELFDINQQGLLTDGIEAMYIEHTPRILLNVIAAVPDCANTAQVCVGPAVSPIDSVSLEDILIDNVSINPAAHSEATMALLLAYVENLLEPMYQLAITIVNNGGGNFAIQVCASHADINHPDTVEIVAMYRRQPPMALSGAAYHLANGSGSPPAGILWNVAAPVPGTYTIILRDLDWASPADNWIVGTQVLITSICGGEGTSLVNRLFTWFNANYPGEFTLNQCIGGSISITQNAALSQYMHILRLEEWLLPAQVTQECTWTSANITGGSNPVPVYEDTPCTTDDTIFHVN